MKMINTIPALPVHDIEKAVRFYEAKFGFTNTYNDTGFAKLERDEIELHLWKANDKNWKLRNIFLFARPISSGAECFLACTHSCRIQVDEIAKFYNEFKQSEVLYNSQTNIEKTDWGTMEFPTLDLNGNLLTFFESI